MNNAIYRQNSGELTFCTPKTEKDCKKLILRKKFSARTLHRLRMFVQISFYNYYNFYSIYSFYRLYSSYPPKKAKTFFKKSLSFFKKGLGFFKFRNDFFSGLFLGIYFPLGLSAGRSRSLYFASSFSRSKACRIS